eukprot:7601-Eustigmatos_ZCMA.PRE.1
MPRERKDATHNKPVNAAMLTAKRTFYISCDVEACTPAPGELHGGAKYPACDVRLGSPVPTDQTWLPAC